MFQMNVFKELASFPWIANPRYKKARPPECADL